ncbi:MAG: cell division protein FtsA [Spirochaetales bacterium]|nr:cell division protein FtsA [Spirochaetales bacterium]
MAGDRIMMGLDIGSSMTRAVIGSVSRDGQLMIDALCEKPSEGVRSGSILNIEQALKVVNSVINESELQAGVEISAAVLGIGGDHIVGIPSNGVVPINNMEQEVKRDDIFRSIDVAKAVDLPRDKEILHVLVQEFIVDSRAGIKDPIDMTGHRLESKVLLIGGSTSVCQNQRKCIQKAGLQVQRIMLQAVADSEVVLSAEEKEMGTILINIGGGTTNMIAYNQGGPVYAGGVALGGEAVTSDIAYILNKPKQLAEQIKCEYGNCYVPSVDPEDVVLVPQVGGMPPERIAKKALSEVIEPRMAEIFIMLQSKLEKLNLQKGFGGGVVLVGGGSLLSGVADLASEIFRMPARIGFPEAMGGLDRNYINPQYATVLGLLKSEAKKVAMASNTASRKDKESRALFCRIKGLFGRLF